jgi:hypothetical protein
MPTLSKSYVEKMSEKIYYPAPPTIVYYAGSGKET